MKKRKCKHSRAALNHRSIITCLANVNRCRIGLAWCFVCEKHVRKPKRKCRHPKQEVQHREIRDRSGPWCLACGVWLTGREGRKR